MSPTIKNVFNKFSVRFFLRLVIKITPSAKTRVETHSDDENSIDADTQAVIDELDDEEIDSNYIEVVFWR